MYFPLSSFIPYDPKLSTYIDEQFLFYKISNLQKREKDVIVMPSGNPCTRILPQYQNHFDCASQKDWSSGNENKNRSLRHFFNFLLMRSAFRRSVCRAVFAWNFALRQWLQICRQIFSSLRAVFPFRLLYSFLTYWFLYCGATVPRLYQQGEKNNSSKTSLCIYFHYVI